MLTVFDAAFRDLLPESSKLEKVVGGRQFTEGPIWVRGGGYLLFTDIPANAIMKWAPGSAEPVVFRQPVFDGAYPGGQFVGANGLTLDAQGRLTSCEHGNRRVARTEQDGTVVTLADRFQGKRLNSPNDLVYKSNGDLYFTDPPYGFLKQDDDPAKELPFNGIYRLTPLGRLDLLVDTMTRPNGLAFSPDETKLYVANSDASEKIWMVFDIAPDGSLRKGSVFADLTSEAAPGLPDGMKIDKQGNIFATGPGGVWVFSPDGGRLGLIAAPEVPANCTWGDEDGRTLYITARTSVYRIRLATEGIRP